MPRSLVVELQRGLARFRYVTPWRLVSDLSRARRLRRGEPVPSRLTPRGERIVVTLTTTPERVAHIRPVLLSLLDQTSAADRIILALPTRAMRSGQTYPSDLEVPAGVDILSCEDQGPATKILPALLAEPSAVLVVVDDDVIYPVDLLATLLQAHRVDRRAALGWRGIHIEPGVDPRDYRHVFATAVARPTQVDVLFGTWGYLVPPGAFDASIHDFSAAPPELRWLDDFWISGHLARRGVPRWIVPGRGLPLETRSSSMASLDRGPNRSRHNTEIAIAAFAAWW